MLKSVFALLSFVIYFVILTSLFKPSDNSLLGHLNQQKMIGVFLILELLESLTLSNKVEGK